MKIITKTPDIAIKLNGRATLTFEVSKSSLEQIKCLKTDILELTIKEFSEKRSLTQNAYMWSLLDQIAIKLNEKPINIYKDFIKDYGVKDYVLVSNEAVDKLTQKWCSNGIGWLVDVLRKGKIEGTTTLVLYSGSSSYNKTEMIRLIEPIVETCEKLKIPTMKMEEFKKLKNDVEK